MNRIGRSPSIDLIGQRFGKLVAEGRVVVTQSSGRKQGLWLCACDCGNKTTVRCSVLLNGNTKSCGCWRGRPLEAGQSARNSILYRYKENAKKANRVWSLSEEIFDRLTSSDCHYCGQSPSNRHKLHTGLGEFVYSGIDRKDSSLGYTIDNVVSCCKECQKAKSNTPYNQFISFLCRAGNFQLQPSTVE